MCCAVKCALKAVLTVLHLLLVIVFGILAVVGALLKSGLLGDTLVNLISSDATIDKTEKEALAAFMNNSLDAKLTKVYNIFLGSVGVILVSVGAVCALVCLFGWIASCCPCGILLKIYAVLLGIMLATQIAFTGYVFGSPSYLPDQVLGLMDKALKSYNEDPNKNTARVIWSLVMTLNKSVPVSLSSSSRGKCGLDVKASNEADWKRSNRQFDWKMCCVVAQLLKVALTVLHLLLVIVFGILAVVGALLKSGKLTKSIVEKIFPGESIDDTQKEALTVFVNNSLGSVGTIIVSVGVVCLLFCLFGWIASCCPCGILLKLYAVLLGVILVMQISFTGYVFGSPDYAYYHAARQR
nr:unnamed protein product [Spirometra erinaceieuropaei]